MFLTVDCQPRTFGTPPVRGSEGELTVPCVPICVAKTGTYDFAPLSEGATAVGCSAWGDATLKHMED
ncbi:MAG: hypothetical protein ACOCXM_07675 [Myxococcota bacterium]